jgi:hypothetical protein
MKYFLTGLFLLIILNSLLTAQSNTLYKGMTDGISGLNKQMINNSFSHQTYDLSEFEFDPLSAKLNYPVLAGLGTVYLGSAVAVHIYQRNAWWKDERTGFHFQNDWPYARWSDKIGHFFAASLLVHAFSAGLEAANFQTEQAMLYGTAAALAFQFYVEVQDGFGAQWGFSPGDAIANTLGAGYALSQYYFPYLRNFQFKYSYYPSPEMRRGEHKGNIFDDYEGQRHWLSFRMKNLLPGDAADIWPSFLNLAVGMGVKDLDGSGGGRTEIFIALDLNVLDLPLHGRFGNFIKNTLNYFRLPMPGVRVSPDAAFFVLLF